MMRKRTDIASALFAAAGLYFLVCALVFNRFTVDLAVSFARSALHRPWTASPATGAIVRAQIALAVAGAACLAVPWLVAGNHRATQFFRRPLVEKIVLAFLALAVPVTTLEIALRPFTSQLGKETSLFVRDSELGWRMRPLTTQNWGGVAVTTNERGLRGPAVPYRRGGDERRLLWLGDSVTFGFAIADYNDTFPWLVAADLARPNRVVQTINAGVGGYSPWQERAWLAREGTRYRPDLVVVNFVLNDVTEKFTLVRFGGQEEARQLRDSYYSWIDRVFAHSALVMQVRNVTREIKAKRRLGEDLQVGAVQKEMLDVETLMRHPEQQNVRIAWDLTIENLDGIVDTCRENGFGVLVVAFPFAVQLDDPQGLGAPQARLAAWAARRGVDCIDLLPVLARREQTASDLFLDHDHLSAAGHRAVADTLSRFIESRLE